MSMALAVAAALAQRCSPQIALPTMLAVITNESGRDPLAIGDNSTGRSYRPSTVEQAVALARRLIAQGHSIDMGLGQVNSRTAPALGLKVEDAFDPCLNLAAAGRLLAANYRRQAPGSTNVQHAIGRMLSTYNTGDRERGFRNGYVARVYRAAARNGPVAGPLLSTPVVVAARPTASPSHPAGGVAAPRGSAGENTGAERDYPTGDAGTAVFGTAAAVAMVFADPTGREHP